MTLKTLRKEKGLTQAEAAIAAGVSLESYKNHELGRSKMSSPLGKVILDRITAYEKYGFEHGILPLDYIRDALKEVFDGKDIEFAYLFGSYAKGTMENHSDVDLLIFGDITGLAYFGLGGELERALHKRVDVIRFKDVSSNADLIAEIMQTGIKIYDKSERR